MPAGGTAGSPSAAARPATCRPARAPRRFALFEVGGAGGGRAPAGPVACADVRHSLLPCRASSPGRCARACAENPPTPCCGLRPGGGGPCFASGRVGARLGLNGWQIKALFLDGQRGWGLVQLIRECAAFSILRYKGTASVSWCVIDVHGEYGVAENVTGSQEVRGGVSWNGYGWLHRSLEDFKRGIAQRSTDSESNSSRGRRDDGLRAKLTSQDNGAAICAKWSTRIEKPAHRI